MGFLRKVLVKLRPFAHTVEDVAQAEIEEYARHKVEELENHAVLRALRGTPDLGHTAPTEEVEAPPVETPPVETPVEKWKLK